MKLYQLTSTDSCQQKRNFPYNPQGAVEDFAKKNHAITSAAKALLLGDSEEAVREELHKEFEAIAYPTEQTRIYNETQAWREVKRFADSELMQWRDHIVLQGANVDIGVGEDVFVDPDYVTIDKNVLVADAAIDVVKLHAGKNASKKKSEDSLSKYAMLKYGRMLVGAGKKAIIRAVDIYLKRADDAGENSKTPKFEPYLYADGGNNKTVVEEVYIGGTENNDTDALYAPKVQAFVAGHPAEECSEADCAICEFKPFCQYTEPPIKITHEKVARSIRSLALTPEQENAIEYEKGIVRINAGAGVGKTVVVALRTVTLLNKGVRPEEIVLMTFTNAGCEEMRTRIQLYNDDVGTGEDISAMKICTFNSFGDDIIKEEYARFGFSAPPKVIDDVEKARIVSNLLKEHVITGLDYNHFDMNSAYVRGAVWMAIKVFDIIKKGQYTSMDVDQVYSELGQDKRFCKREAAEQLCQLYNEYDALLRENNYIEFTDQEVMLFELLQQDPYYLEKFGYKHIIVDEFQDSNEKQISLLEIMTKMKSFESLMVVGDDSQGATRS